MSPRIPKPNKDGLTGKQYQYLDLPKSMEECYYELELVKFDETDKGDKFAAEFKILDTDTRLKGKASELLDPGQKYAETYFYRTLFSIVCALENKELTKKRVSKLSKKRKELIADLTDGKYDGKTCRLDITSLGEDEDSGRRKTKKIWSALENEE